MFMTFEFIHILLLSLHTCTQVLRYTIDCWDQHTWSARPWGQGGVPPHFGCPRWNCAPLHLSSSHHLNHHHGHGRQWQYSHSAPYHSYCILVWRTNIQQLPDCTGEFWWGISLILFLSQYLLQDTLKVGSQFCCMAGNSRPKKIIFTP